MRIKQWVLGLAVVGAAVGLSATQMRASVLVSDGFDYANGNLAGNTPPVGGAWNAHSGAGSLPIQVNNGTISMAQGSGSREDDNVPFAGSFTASAGDVLYSAFDLTVADPGAAITTTNSTYFAHFLQGTGSFASRVWVTTPASSGYRIALTNGSSLTPASGAPAFSGDLAFGTTYTIVTSYDFTNQKGTLWINPTDAGSASQSATDPGFSDAVTAYAFRQGSGNVTEVVDNLNVGTSFSDVVAPVPEPSVIALGGIGAVLAVARRRRRSA